MLDEEISSMREEQLYEVRRNIGMVFQESALFDSLNVERKRRLPADRGDRTDYRRDP